MNCSRIELITASTILNSSAHQNPSTVNPAINFSASRIIIALITSKKSPSVKMVNGMVKIISSGFTVTFSTESNNATSNALNGSIMSMPGRISAVSTMASVLIKILPKNFILR